MALVREFGFDTVDPVLIQKSCSDSVDLVKSISPCTANLALVREFGFDTSSRFTQMVNNQNIENHPMSHKKLSVSAPLREI